MVKVIDIMGFVHFFFGEISEALAEARENGIRVASVTVEQPEKDEA